MRGPPPPNLLFLNHDTFAPHPHHSIDYERRKDYLENMQLLRLEDHIKLARLEQCWQWCYGVVLGSAPHHATRYTVRWEAQTTPFAVH